MVKVEKDWKKTVLITNAYLRTSRVVALLGLPCSKVKLITAARQPLSPGIQL